MKSVPDRHDISDQVFQLLNHYYLDQGAYGQE